LSADGSLLFRTRPKEDESYFGFLIRLAELNAYDTPYRIIQAARLRSTTLTGPQCESNSEVDLGPLADLCGLKISDLKKLVPSSADEPHALSILGHTLSRSLINLRRPRVCPKCLRESNYCRLQWEFKAVTACPIHQIMLLDECNACGKQLRWGRKNVSLCDCGADWREAPNTPLPEHETALSRLAYQWFGFLPLLQDNSEDNPLYGLDFPNILEALLLVASQQERLVVYTNGKRIFTGKKSREIHYQLVNAFSVFDCWPENFHLFLDQVRSLSKSSKRHTTLQGAFGGIYRQLYVSRSLSPPTVEMLRKEFQQYVSEHWNNGYLGNANWFKSGNYRDKYITRSKACRMLRVDPRTLDRLVSEGKLRAIVRRRSVTRLYLVEAASLEEMRLYRARHLTLIATAKFLGTSGPLILRLVESSLLTPARCESIYKYKHKTPLFEKGAVEDFLSSVLAKTTKPPGFRDTELKSFSSVLRLVTWRLSSPAIDTLIRSILSGLLTPRAEAEDKVGLSRLQFSTQEVHQYLETQLPAQTGVTLRAVGGVESLGSRAKLTYFLAGKKLIATSATRRNGRRCKVITREAIGSFKSEYRLGIEMAHEIGTSMNSLLLALQKLDVHPVSGKSVDGGPRYIFRRRDLDCINLKKIISLIPTKATCKQSRSINSSEAAKMLNMPKSAILQLVENDVLRPYPESLDSARGYSFHRNYIEGFKGQFRKLLELISLKAAAKLLHLSVGNLHVRWVKTGCLSYEISKDGTKRFLRRADVDGLASFKGSVVTAFEAAILLGVPRPYIRQWTKDKLLRFTANPYPQAFRHPVYSKADLGRFRVERQKIGSVMKVFLTTRDEGLYLNLRKKSSHIVDSQGAAEILSLKKKAIAQLVKNGVLVGYSERAGKTGEYLFHRSLIESFVGQLTDLTNLISLPVAAKILQISPSTIYLGWIKSGYLKYESLCGGKKRFLVKSEVEHIASFINSIVTRPKAAIMLGVSRKYIETFLRRERIKPVNNPYPLALPYTMYSRSDFEKHRSY
jgi:predicted site-specific integrase-resolvase